MTITDRPPELGAPPAIPTRSHSVMPRLVVGGVLVLIGGLWLLERTGAVDLSVTAVLALGTMVIGIALMLLAREGAHVGLIVSGTILGLLTLATVAAPFEGFQGGVGDRTVVIETTDEILSDYNIAMGKLVIDLRAIDDLEAPTTLTASVGTGELVIRVPDGTQVLVEARVGAGQLQIFDEVVDGVGIDRTYRSADFQIGEPGLDLDLAAFAGRVEVTDE
jgi:predicted membrane protein